MDQRIWDDMASDYDRSVENNQNSIIVNYLNTEIEILYSLCKDICESNRNCSIIDLGAGTGRVVFALDEMLQKDSIQFYGVEVSDSMLSRANQKNQRHKGNSNIKFLKFDITDPNLLNCFETATPNIVMCLYNTLGVLPTHKRQKFVDNMISIAGDNGLAILTVFNGDNFGFVAPKLYSSMMPMIRQIDENSFDEENKVFQNGLGFRSQWFTKAELKTMLHSNVEPIPIDVIVDDVSYTFGNVFVNRKV